MFICGEWVCDHSYPNLGRMLNGLKGRPEIGHILTQCREAVIENSHGHLLYINCQPEKSVLFNVFCLGEITIHMCYLPYVLTRESSFHSCLS
jgi:hypothetical protein